MKIEWHEIEPDTYEARVGDWLLEVGRHDDGLPWTLWVGLLNEREKRSADPMCGTTYRRTVTGSLDEAQRAAVALAIEKCAPFAATARAEAALAEREACAEVLDAEIAALRALGYERDESGMSVVGWRIKSVRAALDAIRARTTPATLSTDTLAAIAEARGLRVLTAERVAELEAAAKSETHRATCEWCSAPATCIATSEGDPYALACDEHCGHSAEDAGGHAMLSEPGELLALVNALRDRAEDAENDASAAVMAERETCAAIADDEESIARRGSEHDAEIQSRRIAQAIRARSNATKAERG